MKTTTNFRTVKMVQLALFIAIIVIMTFTPIGYIKTPGLEITLLVVPVTVGAILLGPGAGAILGAVFGITSFIQCFGMSPFGTALLGINPVLTFILCMVPRILMGWLTGLIFRWVKRVSRNLAFAVANLVGPILNTVFFMSTLVLLFYHTDYIKGIAESLGAGNVFAFVVLFVTLNGVIEAGICFLIGTIVSKTIDMVENRTSAKSR